jgi:tetratricopeptide (TPR) repeat protein
MLLKNDKALVAYQKSLAIDKNNSDALFRIGIINNKLGFKEEAERIHTSLNNLNPARADELNEIINCKTKCKK